MKITYYGTAASEGFPGLFCSCEPCEKAREKGGKNIRTRSQALIDDTLLIDFPADTYMHMLNFGLDLRKIKTLLITHSHDDHLYPRDFEYRRYGFAYFDVDVKDLTPITVYSSKKSSKSIVDIIDELELEENNGFIWKQAKAFCPFTVGEYKITPLEADHDIRTEPLIYMIEKAGKALLYAHDTGRFKDSTWDYIEKSGARFDFVSLDCTAIIKDYKTNHMGIAGCEAVRERLIETGAADEKTQFCLNHFSHNGLLIHDELVEVAGEKDFLVSYDGAVFEF
ncbi:MAG TPA: MBL fold metallo-hydrolase [Clostridia bacterium]|nr:MBL fold metallo-hydrolase [Clostridia bacterium]